MTVYFSPHVKYATYYRKSNRHNWTLGLLARNELELKRVLEKDKVDFPGFQYGYIEVPEDQRSLDDLPKDTTIIIRSE
jgi:hypothetical protein